ncbi:MAG: hypothetical protein JSU04_07260 [Bdellovibrionales bacterium]|nr:hypothetical protein [Bdellovibrionales bacterium]
MKKILFFAITLLTLNSFAFTSITLQKDIELLPAKFPVKGAEKDLVYKASNGVFNTDCAFQVTDKNNPSPSRIVSAGTRFEVTSVYRNNCGQDWGKQCKLGVSAESSDGNLAVDLHCSHTGVFASKFSPEKVNRYLHKTIHVE